MTKLLVIDDEVEFTNLMQNYFGARGFDVTVANDGSKGLATAQELHPDACIIDLKMPGLHGDEVLRGILRKFPETKCIMCTASEGEGKTRAHLMEFGAYACFDKPISSLRDLEQKLREALAKS